MHIQNEDPKRFLNSIMVNTKHTLSSLAEILDISKKRLTNTNRLSERDYKKINELKELLAQANCRWLE